MQQNDSLADGHNTSLPVTALSVAGVPVWGDQINPAGLAPQHVTSTETCTRPSDLIFFKTECFHSSFGQRHLAAGKRVYQLIFGARPQTEMEWDAARQFLRGEHPERMDDPGTSQVIQKAASFPTSLQKTA